MSKVIIWLSWQTSIMRFNGETSQIIVRWMQQYLHYMHNVKILCSYAKNRLIAWTQWRKRKNEHSRMQMCRKSQNQATSSYWIPISHMLLCWTRNDLCHFIYCYHYCTLIVAVITNKLHLEQHSVHFVPLPCRAEIGTMSSMHSKCVTYLQLELNELRFYIPPDTK